MSYSNFEASDDAIANLNGQYLMNKEISVQYAYKKDGKGERHGDQAERTLAAEAKKHMIQPVGQPLSTHLFTGSTPGAPTAMIDPEVGRMGSIQMSGFTTSRPGPPPGLNYQNQLPPTSRLTPNSQPLPAPPSGLPARPPPSQAGYGGPQGFLPPGFNAPQQPGFAPPGAPPGLPVGFQHAPGARSR